MKRPQGGGGSANGPPRMLMAPCAINLRVSRIACTPEERRDEETAKNPIEAHVRDPGAQEAYGDWIREERSTACTDALAGLRGRKSVHSKYDPRLRSG